MASPFHPIISFFLPAKLKANPLTEEYTDVYRIVSGCLLNIVLMLAAQLVLNLLHIPIHAFLYHAIAFVIFMPFIKWNLYKPLMPVLGLVTYWIYFPVFVYTGGIYSVNLAILYLYLLGAFFGYKTAGIYFVFSNIIVLFILYLLTPASAVLGSKLYAFFIHSFCTIFIGLVFWFIQKKKDLADLEIAKLRNEQIEYLDQQVRSRTAELNTMRQTLAADFHDETGNMLSAITRQAALLKLKANAESLPVVENIIASSNQLYSSSKHFLWNLNNESDDPIILFDYLTAFGQSYYNQFDISFSAENAAAGFDAAASLRPFAAINLIFIFKEGMTNIVKHSGANEVVLKMSTAQNHFVMSLSDNGIWKEPDQSTAHYGLGNIEKRCLRNDLQYALLQNIGHGTTMEIKVPFIQKSPI